MSKILRLPKFSCLFVLLLFIACSKGDGDSEPEQKQPTNPIENPTPEESAGLPELITSEISEITSSTARAGGSIQDDGGAEIIEQGIVYGLESNPDTSDNLILDVGSSNPFDLLLEDLQPETKYYLKALASNSEGTAYGEEREFTTLKIVATEKIFKGNIELLTQGAVDSFGAENYTKVEGQLIINSSDSDPIVSLEPLNTISEVEGDLYIQNLSVSNFNAFENLRIVTEELQIKDNSAITDLTGFKNLILVGSLRVFNNDQLASLDGLQGIDRIEAYITIWSNPLMTSLEGFNNLQYAESLSIKDNINLTDLSALNSLTEILETLVIQENGIEILNAFENLQQVGSWISIERNNTMREVLGFPKLNAAGGLTFSSNENLVSIDGFDELLTITGLNLTLTANPRLTSLSGFQKLESLDGLFISGTGLTSLTGFNNLLTIQNDFLVTVNHDLLELSGFQNLLQIGGKVDVINNHNLNKFDAFNSLEQVQGSIKFNNNFVLNQVNGFGSLNTIGGDFVLAEIPGLTTLDIFESLALINGDISLERLRSLRNISALANVNFDNSSLNLTSLTDLTDVSALSNKSRIGGTLLITGCSSLINLQGLESIEEIGGNLEIINNPSLSNLDELQSLLLVRSLVSIRGNNNLNNFCGIVPLIQGGGLSSTSYFVFDNLFNPRFTELENGICSQ